MLRTIACTAALVLAVLLLAGCGSARGASSLVMPQPSPGDTEGQIMSVTGEGFTICGISKSTPGHFNVTVCGDLAKARAVLDARFPGQAVPAAYRPDDGGDHSPQSLVAQYWVNRTTGDGFKVSTTRITGDGKIEVGIDGDLDKARAVLDRELPGLTSLHEEKLSTAL